MNYILVFRTMVNHEQEIDMETSNIEEAIHIANQYVRGREDIVEYAYLSNGTTTLKFFFSTGSFQDIGEM